MQLHSLNASKKENDTLQQFANECGFSFFSHTNIITPIIEAPHSINIFFFDLSKKVHFLILKKVREVKQKDIIIVCSEQKDKRLLRLAATFSDYVLTYTELKKEFLNIVPKAPSDNLQTQSKPSNEIIDSEVKKLAVDQFNIEFKDDEKPVQPDYKIKQLSDSFETYEKNLKEQDTSSIEDDEVLFMEEDEILLDETHEIEDEILFDETHEIEDEILLDEAHEIEDEVLLDEAHEIEDEVLLDEDDEIEDEVLLDDDDKNEPLSTKNEVEEVTLAKNQMNEEESVATKDDVYIDEYIEKGIPFEHLESHNEEPTTVDMNSLIASINRKKQEDAEKRKKEQAYLKRIKQVKKEQLEKVQDIEEEIREEDRSFDSLQIIERPTLVKKVEKEKKKRGLRSFFRF